MARDLESDSICATPSRIAPISRRTSEFRLGPQAPTNNSAEVPIPRSGARRSWMAESRKLCHSPIIRCIWSTAGSCECIPAARMGLRPPEYYLRGRQCLPPSRPIYCSHKEAGNEPMALSGQRTRSTFLECCWNPKIAIWPRRELVAYVGDASDYVDLLTRSTLSFSDAFFLNRRAGCASCRKSRDQHQDVQKIAVPVRVLKRPV